MNQSAGSRRATTTGSENVNSLVDELHDATGNRSLARRLAAVIADGTSSYAAEMRELARKREARVRGGEAAELVKAASARVLVSLTRADRFQADAIVAGYIRGSFDLSSGDFRTFADWGLGRWVAADKARSALEQLQREAADWASRARVDARRPSHRPSPEMRRLFAGWIGFLLVKGGVTLSKARTGTYARVLAVAYRAAGIELRDVSRDIRVVVDDSELWKSMGLNPHNPRRRRG